MVRWGSREVFLLRDCAKSIDTLSCGDVPTLSKVWNHE
jgi:hypothetical protein